MIRSMTGFARRERQFPWGLLAWEIKTVNHRFLELGCRLPEEFRSAESDFRAAVAAAVRRGKVECSLHLRPAVAAAAALEVDADLLASLTSRAQQVAAQAGVAARIDVLDLLRWPGVIRDSTRDTTPMIAAAHALLAEALADLGRSRDSEGGRLRDALEQRCAGLLEFSARVTDRLPEIRARMRAKLLDRIAQLVTDVDEDRLEQELAILAQRLDVDEEIDRLRGHVTEVRKTFGGKEPAGRRLDFLMQELNREANTLSSKSQDIETTRAAVDMKVLIEQMREQVQNIE
ncbi:MAG TPA: YicC/YloC family endoribonuclease [Steroidobacteraceae bacterium]|nr:YicC/YloC family endoribonuclease [Steroidobacteraceae bacterium]